MAGKFCITLFPKLGTFKGDYRTARRDGEEEGFSRARRGVTHGREAESLFCYTTKGGRRTDPASTPLSTARRGVAWRGAATRRATWRKLRHGVAGLNAARHHGTTTAPRHQGITEGVPVSSPSHLRSLIQRALLRFSRSRTLDVLTTLVHHFFFEPGSSQPGHFWSVTPYPLKCVALCLWTWHRTVATVETWLDALTTLPRHSIVDPLCTVVLKW